jgi:DNA repair protein RecN (Recombination protein N)
MKTAHQSLAALRDQRESLQHSQAERNARLELLRYQTEELDALQLQDGDIERLEEEHHRLANVQHLQELSDQVLYELLENESGALLDRLDRVQAQLDELTDIDSAANPAADLFRNGLVQLQEAAAELRRYRDRVEGDPERLQETEQRLAVLNDLARKHHVGMTELPQLCADLQNELQQVEASQVQLAGLDERVSNAEQTCIALAGKLTQARRKTAKQLAKAVVGNMTQLGMANGQFSIELIPLEDAGPHGAETIEFQVTTNPGQPLRAIAKVASGGELSRISLALQVIIAGKGRIPTLIFDEVDVGIGGGTAEVVGRLLYQLGRDRQVICVTHQPQVAALADQHLLVHKLTGDTTTHTSVRELPHDERVEEIARMLGGLEITAQTRSHAQEMLERAG